MNSHAAASFALLLAAAIPGQQGEPGNHLPGQPDYAAGKLPAPATTSLTHAPGLSVLDETLVGGGPDYAVRFEGDRIVFTPALPTADRLFPVTMSVVSYGRGEANQIPAAGRLTHAGNTAFYHRKGFVESYEARADGLKQSFTFAHLPAGTGDLIVRLQLSTDLAVQADRGPDGELTFLSANAGGVSIGKVLGIDSSGAEAVGTMRYEAGSLELRLPASFVDHAAMPLVLDPLVGTAFAAAIGSDDNDLDIAYDSTSNAYLATWRRRFSTTSYAVRAQRINDSGGLSGGLITVQSLGASTAPRVANVQPENAFLVVFGQNNNILGRPVAGVGGIVGGQVVIRDTADILSAPDVGGEAAIDDEAIVVWRNATTGEIQATQVNVNGGVSPPTAAPFAQTYLIADSGPSFSNSVPRISNSGGSTGYHCIVYSRQFTWATETAVRGAIVNRNCGILHTVLSFTQPSEGDCDLPTVDGDGRNWVVAWENEAVPASGDNNVQARAVGYDPNAAALNHGYFASGIVDIEAGLNDDERVANVTWMGDSVLITYEDETAVNFDYDVFAQPVDLFTCLDCAPRMLVDAAGGDQGPIRAASKANGGGTLDDAVIVWSERNMTTGDNDGYAIRYRADDGISTNLGGGCGSGGAARADCAVVGNSAFQARLRGSLPSTSAWWVMSPGRFDWTCGACTLVPDPYQAFIVSRLTDIRGDASVAVAIPSTPALAGATFYHQWLALDPSSAACAAMGSDLSNALKTQIQ